MSRTTFIIRYDSAGEPAVEFHRGSAFRILVAESADSLCAATGHHLCRMVTRLWDRVEQSSTVVASIRISDTTADQILPV